MKNINVSKIAPYAKAIVALGGAVIVAAKVLVDGVLTPDEMTEVAIAFGIAFGVWRVPNKVSES